MYDSWSPPEPWTRERAFWWLFGLVWLASALSWLGWCLATTDRHSWPFIVTSAIAGIPFAAAALFAVVASAVGLAFLIRIAITGREP